MVISQDNNLSRDAIYRKDTVTDMQKYPSLHLESKASLIKSRIYLDGSLTPQRERLQQLTQPRAKYIKHNMSNLTDEEIQYLMFMQSRGLDAQGKPLSKNDYSLDKLINMYLNR
jgi:hypothetical protein